MRKMIAMMKTMHRAMAASRSPSTALAGATVLLVVVGWRKVDIDRLLRLVRFPRGFGICELVVESFIVEGIISVGVVLVVSFVMSVGRISDAVSTVLPCASVAVVGSVIMVVSCSVVMLAVGASVLVESLEVAGGDEVAGSGGDEVVGI